ncbi:MAG TPA: hypothetical protein DCK98_09260 [Chloroflexi bacterium]|jgi:hypothetical protein|nr:hypothetical protein [Chloroflexota bacterium]HAL26859.1 hypothetical protein [Chloroflexota bacterium]
MGESPSARTERELADLRRKIDDDVDALIERAKSDVDPRNLVRRQPVATLGTLGSVAALAGITIAKKVRDARGKQPDTEIERIAERLGGRIDRLKGRARKRFREQLRTEIADVQSEQRGPKEALWGAGLAAITAAATTFAHRFAGRLASDDPEDGKPGY